MRVLTGFTSLLIASVALASPVPVGTSLVERQLCQVGVPCFVQAEVNNALLAVNNAVSIAEGPADQVVTAVNACASALLKVSVDLQGDVAGLAGDAKTQLVAQVVAAITILIGNIRSDLTLVTNNVPVLTVEVTAAVSAVTSAISAIEAVVGPC